MKEIATFIGGSGKFVAAIYQQEGGMFQVNLSEDSSGVKSTSSKIFRTEEDATTYAEVFTSKGNQSRLLNENA
jgi:hypothetical protein